MPVKSHSENSLSSADASTSSGGRTNRLSKKLSKREIKMPDGRYMIFYTESSTKPTPSEKTK